MNKSSKITALLLVLILVLSLTACSGGSDGDYGSDHGESYYDNEDEESSVVLAAELSGTWSSERGNILELDFDNETYYETLNTETISAVFGNTPEEIL